MDASRRTYALAGLVIVAALAGGFVVADRYFLPETATTVDAGPENETAETLAVGIFTGKAGHDVSGTVELKRDDEGYYLRFENYSQQQGPAVYLYLTAATDPDATGEVEAASSLKVPVDGGPGGEITKVGTFVQRLPEDFDPSAYQGVAIWCDDFDVPFGAATLEST